MKQNFLIRQSLEEFGKAANRQLHLFFGHFHVTGIRSVFANPLILFGADLAPSLWIWRSK